MPDYYVALVKEYLELNGFIVKTETKYPIIKKNVVGNMSKSWGDIDIIAVKTNPNKTQDIWVAEVKAEGKTEKEIKRISGSKFENVHVRKKLTELFGSKQYSKFLFCWNCNAKTREATKKIGITIISYDEIINFMLEAIEKKEGYFYEKDFPNLMLLQLLNDKQYLTKPDSQVSKSAKHL